MSGVRPLPPPDDLAREIRESDARARAAHETLRKFVKATKKRPRSGAGGTRRRRR